jgi:uncharacterized membrane protein
MSCYFLNSAGSVLIHFLSYLILRVILTVIIRFFGVEALKQIQKRHSDRSKIDKLEEDNYDDFVLKKTEKEN